MRWRRIRLSYPSFILMAFAIVTAASSSAGSAGINTRLSRFGVDEGWINLFNGRDMQGWRMVGKGYFKVDFLHNTIYQGIRDETHLIELLTTEPPWDLFDDEDVVNSLAHVSGHFGVVHSIGPKSIGDLAICIALIRPGKKHLIGKPRSEIDRHIWIKPNDGGYHFKKSHAISYASAIVVQLNLMIERATQSTIL